MLLDFSEDDAYESHDSLDDAVVLVRKEGDSFRNDEGNRDPVFPKPVYELIDRSTITFEDAAKSSQRNANEQDNHPC